MGGAGGGSVFEEVLAGFTAAGVSASSGDSAASVPAYRPCVCELAEPTGFLLGESPPAPVPVLVLRRELAWLLMLRRALEEALRDARMPRLKPLPCPSAMV